MKPSTILSLLLLFSTSVIAQSPSWVWANSAGGYRGVECNNLCTDAGNNAYVTGAFYDSSIIFGNDTLVNYSTGTNMFLVKYSPNGAVLWAKNAPGSASSGQNVCTGAAGNLYLTGRFFSHTIVFGTDTLVSPSTASFFIVKYDATGNVIWARTVGGNSTSFTAEGYGIAADNSGHIFVTGYFSSSYIVFATDTVRSSGSGGGFIAKYDTSGNFDWAESAETGNIIAVSPDAEGNAYVTGLISATVTLGTFKLTDLGLDNIFIARYNSSGNVIWAYSMPGTGNDDGVNIITDGNANVYVAGQFSSPSIVFGNDTLYNSNPNSDGHSFDVFLAKYTTAGNPVWIRSGNGQNTEADGGLSLDANGHPYLSGRFSSPALIFGDDTLFNLDTSGIRAAAFLVEYNSSGNATWATSIGGNSGDEEPVLGIDSKGDIYIAGSFVGSTIIFGNDTLIGTPGDSASLNGDFYIAKYGIADTTGITNTPLAINIITVYPNPSTGQFYFKGITGGSTLQVFNVLGQNVFSTIVSPSGGSKPATPQAWGEETYLLNISSQAKGIYFYRVMNNGNTVQDGKMVVE